MLKQVIHTTYIGVQELFSKPGTVSVAILGIAGTVSVFVSMLAFTSSITGAMRADSDNTRVVVVRAGAETEFSSSLSREAIATIGDAPGVQRSAGGGAMVSSEVLVALNLTLPNGTKTQIPLRGVTKRTFELRPQIRVIQGREIRDGFRELMVGRLAADHFGMKIGDELPIRGRPWTVVGMFKSAAGPYESEVLGDVTLLQSDYRRQSFQSSTVVLNSAAAFTQFKSWLASNPTLSVEAMYESEWLAQQGAKVSETMRWACYLIGGLMGIGAAFISVNTMLMLVDARRRGIATLRAIGFPILPIWISVLLEMLLLAILGGAAGSTIAWLVMDGNLTSVGGTANSQLAFEVAVSWSNVAVGVGLSLLIGLMSGIPPAFASTRIPLAYALRDVT